MSIEQEVLGRIKPTAEEAARILETAEELRSAVVAYLDARGLDVAVRFVGSVAKGTYLRDPDLDIFLMFPESVPKEEMERIGLQAGEDVLHGGRMYAEHPYTRGVFRGLDVDMVPCYRIESTERLLSPVDRTPFHTDYVLAHTDARMRDEIRLMKRFMKGIGAYGAEPNTRGFSGYMCELITIRYGGFVEALIAAAEWKGGVTIAVERKGPPMVAPIVLYDPVDPRRNVASAVHLDTFAGFVTACRMYLRRPSVKFFFPEERAPMGRGELAEAAEAHGSRLLTVKFARPAVNEDNLHSQLWKTQYALGKKLDQFSFNVLRAVHDMGADDVTIVFELERDRLSKTHKHVGPPVWVRTSETFLSKWRGGPFGDPFIEDGHWTVIAERLYFTAAEMITDEGPIAGIGREIDPGTMEIYDHGRTLAEADPALLTELLDPKLSWEVRAGPRLTARAPGTAGWCRGSTRRGPGAGTGRSCPPCPWRRCGRPRALS